MSPPDSEIEKSLDDRNVEIQMVVFSLAACEVCVEIHQVREIIRLTEMTMVPKSPEYLEGVINLRGRVVPVLDLKKKFKMPLVDKTEESRILVVEMKAQILGLRVDKVSEVMRIKKNQIEMALNPVLNIALEYFEGFFLANRRLILLLNLTKLMSLDEIRLLPEMESEPRMEGQKLGY